MFPGQADRGVRLINMVLWGSERASAKFIFFAMARVPTAEELTRRGRGGSLQLELAVPLWKFSPVRGLALVRVPVGVGLSSVL